MEKDTKKNTPILGFDELFDTGVIVDGTEANLEEIDSLMKEYFISKSYKISTT